ncbi:hypothetical protein PVAP13_5NG451780 [Panicum virgatum]|uniref:Secreted protein n=1 Tax=Panicum virgatum TaxID=38727 RepID=A0A8T0S2G4_PANVG|nr:hypothetical protein PVAP13_5NG451780 [Panicum virgatum]
MIFWTSKLAVIWRVFLAQIGARTYARTSRLIPYLIHARAPQILRFLLYHLSCVLDLIREIEGDRSILL